jgi:hypothetical protein
LGPADGYAHAAALRLEKELAWARADAAANAAANATANATANGSSSSSGSGRPAVVSTLDLEALRRRREELDASAPPQAAARASWSASSSKPDAAAEADRAAYAAEADRAQRRADAAAVAASGGPSRLVPHEIWTLCLEQTQPARSNTTAPASETAQGSDEASEGANEAVSAADAAARAGERAAGAAAAHAAAYEAAAEGCAKLFRNETWVCPLAEERLASLLPRFPVEPALAAAVAALAAGRSALAAARDGLGSGRRSAGAAQQLLAAARSGRALSHAALRVAKQQLGRGNATANWLRSDGEDAAGKNLEAAKHRSWALERAAFDLTEGKNREFYDKPCKPVFGACCARDQADGGMNIICG